MMETADFLGLNTDEFIHRFLFKRKYRFYINEIKNGDNYSCIFYHDRKGCTIYNTRPDQCRSFPFWDEFAHSPENAARECPGVTLL